MLQIRNASTVFFATNNLYVTLGEKQTIPQATVKYLVGLTSLSSENSLYFIPYSVTAPNGRYTKLTFIVKPYTTEPKPEPADGEIMFYITNAGGFDVYPMGFYKYTIQEQTSSTNLDPTSSGAILETGTAYIYDYDGNFEELPTAFTEYTPTTPQYVYP